MISMTATMTSSLPDPVGLLLVFATKSHLRVLHIRTRSTAHPRNVCVPRVRLDEFAWPAHSRLPARPSIISVLNLIEFMPSAPPTNSGGRVERTICPGGSNLGVKSRTEWKMSLVAASDQVSNLILLSSRDALASLWIVLSGKKWIPTRPQALSCLTSTGSIEGSPAVIAVQCAHTTPG